jgi:hypothetical protein
MDAPKITTLWREEKFSYMLFTGKAGGGWREVNDGAVVVLVGWQREVDTSHRLSQIRRHLQTLLPKPRATSIPNLNFVVSNQTQRRRCQLQLLIGGGCGDVVRWVIGHEVVEFHVVVGGGGDHGRLETASFTMAMPMCGGSRLLRE